MPLRASWSSASFLLYAGGIVILIATGVLLGALGGEYGDAAFAGWSILVFVVLGDLAVAARRLGRPNLARFGAERLDDLRMRLEVAL